MAFTSPKMGLRIWNLLTDLYDHAQLADNWAKLDYHDHSPGRGVQIPGEGIADDAIGGNHIQAGSIDGADLNPDSITEGQLADGAVTEDKLANDAVAPNKLSQAAAEFLGVSQTGEARRGVFSQAAAGVRTNTAYGNLDNGPDQVSVVLPGDGLIFITYAATWKNQFANAGGAAIFLGASQLAATYSDSGSIGPSSPFAAGSSIADNYRPLMSTGGGLTTLGPAVSGDTARPVITGEVIGSLPVGTNAIGSSGLIIVEADAGTYNVNIQFKSSSGSVTVKNRKLRVWTIAF